MNRAALDRAEVGQLPPMSVALWCHPSGRVRELGEVVARRGSVADAVALVESRGLAMQDVAFGARVLERARPESVGREVDLGGVDA